MDKLPQGITAGTPLGGGFYTGVINIAGVRQGLVTASKDPGELTGEWSKKYQDLAGARSFFDGRANTQAMAEAGSVIAQLALNLVIDGVDGWHIPSRDELELQYRAFKPTRDDNWVFRNGDNPSSVPPGYPYTQHLPAQTDLTAFRPGGAEAFDPGWYFSSTQYSEDTAWGQYFYDGSQSTGDKKAKALFRLVRWIPLGA